MKKSVSQLAAEHQALLDAAVDAIIVIDHRGRIETMNTAAQSLFMYTESEVEGKNVDLLMPEPHHSKHDSYMDNYLNSGDAKIIGIGREVRAKRKDGHLVPIHLSVGEFKVDGRSKFVGIIHDLSEQKKKETALKQAREEARKSRERLAHVDRLTSMGEMAAGIAHEINQPLAAISSYSAGLNRMIEADNLDQADLKQALDKIAQQAHRAGEVIKRIRQFVKKKGDFVETDPNKLAEDIVNLVEIDTRKSGFVLTLDLSPNLPSIKADPVQIQQVLVNLIRNAFEAMKSFDRAGNEIIIKTALFGDNMIEFAVIDQGPGIDSEEGDIFVPFVSSKEQGMGMGLSISDTIVRAHGGELGFDNNETLGATLYFRIPAYNNDGKPE